MHPSTFAFDSTSVAFIVLLAATACGEGDDDATAPPPVPMTIPDEVAPAAPRFRSYTMLPTTSTGTTNCMTLRGASPGALRPMCAKTAVVSGRCSVTGLYNAGCECFEGQAYACDPDLSTPTMPVPCSTGENCGIRACIVQSDISSRWHTECVRLTRD